MNILILFLLGTQTSACVFGADKTRWKRNQNTDWTNRKKQHLGLELSARDLRKIATFSDESHFNKTLDAILVERVVGTENHRRVRKHIHKEMESLGWTVEEHAFDQRTPIGTKRFTNLIATLNPYSARRLVIACHYDSKITPKGFLGATDSAVPCAMMVNLAYTMKDILCTHCEQDEVTLQFIFFDGEEAFEKWTTTDSLYGSRRLASDWQNTPFPANGQSRTTELDRIDMFVLLDLLGMKSTSFVGLSSETEHWYDKLRTIENQLKSNKILNLNLVKKQTHYYARIEDDHIPFQQRGVPILHLISVPFPSVWHKIGDNGNALHFPTIKHLNTLLRAFSAHYLHLNV